MEPGARATPAPMTIGPAMLFCPADRPDRYGRALAAADQVILDLEDAVPVGRRAAARQALAGHRPDRARTVIRINPAGTADHAADLELLTDLEVLAGTGYRTVMLAKAESAAQVAALAPRPVIALCETPKGVLAAAEIAAVDNVIGMMWGSEDLVAATGGTSSSHSDGRRRDLARFARIQVLLAAAAFGRAAIDSVHLDVADDMGLAARAEDGFASGFAATACIHPRQVPIVRAAARPTPVLLAWAQRVLEAVSSGVALVDGVMIDEPLLRQARTVVTRAGSGTGPTTS